LGSLSGGPRGLFIKEKIMAFYTGTATSYLNLASIMDTNLVTEGWTKRREQTFTNEKEYIWTSGTTGGPTIGLRTYRDAGAGLYNFSLFGLTGFADNGLPIEFQPGASLSGYIGDNYGTTGDPDYGSIVPLINTSFTYWMAVSATRIVVVAKLGGNYSSLYMGFTKVDEPTTMPYPLLILGSTHVVDKLSTDTDYPYRSIIDPIARTAIEVGYQYGGPSFLLPDGTWEYVANTTGRGGVYAQTDLPGVTTALQVYPLTTYDSAITSLYNYANQEWFSIDRGWQSFAPPLDTTARTFRLMPIQHPTDTEWLLVPAQIVGGRTVVKNHYGSLEGVHRVSAQGGLALEDEIRVDGTDHIVFKNGASTHVDHFWTLAKE